MRICISRLDRMGDMILTLPAIKAIKIMNPDIKIYVLASTRNAKVLTGLNYIDKIIIVDTKFKIIKLFKTIFIIRKFNFDFYLSISPTLLSYIICFFSNANKKGILIFLSRYKKNLFSKIFLRIFASFFCQYIYKVDRYKKIKTNQEIHQTKMIFNLINICSIPFAKNTLIDILLPNKKLSIVPKNKNLITIHIPDRWINKFYNEENFFKLISLLPKNKFFYILTTDKSTKNKFKKIFKTFKIINNNNFKIIKQLTNNITIFDEPNYNNWLKVIYSSIQVITPECGCSHISAACNTPVNIIYNPNNSPNAIYKEYHPWKSQHKKFYFNDENLNDKIVKNLI